MKKYLLCILVLLVVGTAKAEGVNYGVYSEDYHNCLSNSVDSPSVENCYAEEYYRIRGQIDLLKQKINSVPEFAKYNDTELSLVKSVDSMQKYNDLHCKYMYTASEQQMSINECKMQMANYLHVDLYKIYEAMQNKKSKEM